MKINKILLRISHFFGFRKGEAHLDDITMTIPTIYPIKDFKRFSGNNRGDDSQSVKDDIKNQIFTKFEEDPTFKKKCMSVEQVWVNVDNELFRLVFFDGVLYYPCKSEMDAMVRDRKLKSIGV